MSYCKILHYQVCCSCNYNVCLSEDVGVIALWERQVPATQNKVLNEGSNTTRYITVDNT